MKDSTILRGINDLQKYGINFLTGEACSYGTRVLCDLNEDGVKVVSSWLGIKEDSFPANWNSKVNGKPAVASFLLPLGCLRELFLWVLIHVEKYEVVLDMQHSDMVGMNKDSEHYKLYTKLAAEMKALGEPYTVAVRHFQQDTERSVSGRNVHQFSGRVA